MSFPFCPMLYTPCLSMYSCIFNFVNFKPNYIVRYLPLCALWDISTLCFVRYFHFLLCVIYALWDMFTLCLRYLLCVIFALCDLWYISEMFSLCFALWKKFYLCFVRYIHFVPGIFALWDIFTLCLRLLCFVRYIHIVPGIFTLCLRLLCFVRYLPQLSFLWANLSPPTKQAEMEQGWCYYLRRNRTKDKGKALLLKKRQSY